MAEERTAFRCPNSSCYRTYNSEKNLHRHVRAFHNEEKKYECEFCGKQLASTQNLREHTYLHTGEKPYECDFPGCYKRFRQGSQFSAHRKSHPPNPLFPPQPDPAELQVNFRYCDRLSDTLTTQSESTELRKESIGVKKLPSIKNTKNMGPLPTFFSIESFK